MHSATLTSLEADLSEIGALAFFKHASSKHMCSYITGFGETVVSIGRYKQYLVGNGLVTLDPLQADRYDPTLVKDLSGEHLLIAAIPFDPQVAFQVTVPEVTVVFAQKGGVSISMPQDDHTQALDILQKLVHGTARNTISNAPQLRGVVIYAETKVEFENRVNHAIQAIKNTSLSKVVLSQSALISYSERPNPQFLFDKLVEDRPATYLFSLGNYLGASPELVVNLKGSSLISHPLAGTAQSATMDSLLLSDKDNREHNIVVRQINARLLELGISSQHQSKPTIASYGEIVHLGSRISGQLSLKSPLTSIEIAAHLAPTAAVNGEPYGDAMSYILSNEAPSRGLYGGLVGYQKMGGDGSWILNIRSIELEDYRAILRAGVGIVDGSNPSTEYFEATSKIDVVASSILDP